MCGANQVDLFGFAVEVATTVFVIRTAGNNGKDALINQILEARGMGWGRVGGCGARRNNFRYGGGGGGGGEW